jgi:hypothetical protein
MQVMSNELNWKQDIYSFILKSKLKRLQNCSQNLQQCQRTKRFEIR